MFDLVRIIVDEALNAFLDWSLEKSSSWPKSFENDVIEALIDRFWFMILKNEAWSVILDSDSMPKGKFWKLCPA